MIRRTDNRAARMTRGEIMTNSERERLQRFIELFNAEQPDEQKVTLAMLWGMLPEGGKDGVLKVLEGGKLWE